MTFDWIIIGAGPAGIATVGKLIDNGINPRKIAWLDPEFKVGDFGTLWQKVPSNTRIELFLKFFKACHSFQFAELPKNFSILNADPNQTCLLALATEALQWITDKLKNKVNIIYGKAERLQLLNRQWQITLKDTTLYAKNVVLAIGAQPKSLDLPNVKEIPLSVALNPEKLQSTCDSKDTIAVFGSSHSAIIILKNLLEQCAIKKVINFYRSPLKYAVYFNDSILFDDTGLKGTAANWAREYIDGQLPTKLERIFSNEQNIRSILPLCNKAIYATGFQRRHILVEGLPTLEYNAKNGILAPGLFGVGIAFPEAKIDCYDTLSHRVGLWKFMEYLNHIMPIWIRYGT